MLNSKVIGETIKKIRISKQMTQEITSGLAGIDRTHYSKIERGLRMPNLETIFKISFAFGIPANEIIKEIEKAVID